MGAITIEDKTVLGADDPLTYAQKKAEAEFGPGVVLTARRTGNNVEIVDATDEAGNNLAKRVKALFKVPGYPHGSQGLRRGDSESWHIHARGGPRGIPAHPRVGDEFSASILAGGVVVQTVTTDFSS